MDKWNGKVAVVTGSSAGIGASVTIALANAGMLVVGLARRVEAIEVSSKHLRNHYMYISNLDFSFPVLHSLFICIL